MMIGCPCKNCFMACSSLVSQPFAICGSLGYNICPNGMPVVVRTFPVVVQRDVRRPLLICIDLTISEHPPRTVLG